VIPFWGFDQHLITKKAPVALEYVRIQEETNGEDPTFDPKESMVRH